MIFYASFTETSVSKLFTAGIAPALLLMALLMIYIAVVSVMKKPVLSVEHSGRRSVRQVVADVLPFYSLIVRVLGSIYTGIATPTEAAALGCLLALVVCRFWGDLDWKAVKEAFLSTVEIIGNILFIITAAYIYAYAISLARVGDDIAVWMTGLALGKLEFLLLLFVLYLLLGTFLDTMSMIILTVPCSTRSR